MANLRRLTDDDWKLFREIRLTALAEAPYAYSSRLSDWQGENDAEPRWRQRLTAVPFNVAAYVDGAAAGIVSATAPNDEGAIELISMWVAPFARGSGTGDALIRAAIEYGRTVGAQSAFLHVREANATARKAYERNGFVDVGLAAQVEEPPERRMVFRFED